MIKEKNSLIDTYVRFKDYDRDFRFASSETLFPPEIYMEIKKYLKGIILDIGTGDGFKLENMLKRCGNKVAKVIAIEPSPLHKIARERFNQYSNVEVINTAFEDFDINIMFDTILLLEVIEHIPSPLMIMHKIIRILKPDGCLIISTPNRYISDFGERLVHGRVDPTHVGEMDIFTFTRFINSYFKEIRLRGILPMMKIGRKIPLLLKMHRYIALPILYNTIFCFAKSPRKIRF